MKKNISKNVNGYEQYFKARQKAMGKSGEKIWAGRSHGIWLISISTLLAGGCVWYLLGGDQKAANYLSHIDISFLGEASADDGAGGGGKDAAAKSADDKQKSEEKTSADGTPTVPVTKAPPKTWSEEEVTLFTKLDERKKQLDAREASLTKLEEELQQQKTELEKKLASLEEVRGKIANKLEDKVKIDQAKVESLVSVYANMKPVQAAQIISGLNEDLAVEVLGKMKNKAAAEILNLMDADKAKKLSERFAGFREPASAPSAAN